MQKWADYLISEVSYDSDHLISVAIRHKDSPDGVLSGVPVDRLTIASEIKNGITYITIYSGNESWKKGQNIQTFSIDGTPYLRIDGNRVKLDNLGDLPNVTSIDIQSLGIISEEDTNEFKQIEQLEKQIQELESQPEPEPGTPEQSSQVSSIQKQIDELENMLSSNFEDLLQTSKSDINPNRISTSSYEQENKTGDESDS